MRCSGRPEDGARDKEAFATRAHATPPRSARHAEPPRGRTTATPRFENTFGRRLFTDRESRGERSRGRQPRQKKLSSEGLRPTTSKIRSRTGTTAPLQALASATETNSEGRQAPDGIPLRRPSTERYTDAAAPSAPMLHSIRLRTPDLPERKDRAGPESGNMSRGRTGTNTAHRIAPLP